MQIKRVIFLFGEAEKGEFCTPFAFQSLPHLVDALGQPPGDSKGIAYAVQAILYQRELIFFRVQEEGFSISDYMKGLDLLQNGSSPLPLSAICMPGVGDSEIIDATAPICQLHKSLLILDEEDLYDYLTAKQMKT